MVYDYLLLSKYRPDELIYIFFWGNYIAKTKPYEIKFTEADIKMRQVATVRNKIQ